MPLSDGYLHKQRNRIPDQAAATRFCLNTDRLDSPLAEEVITDVCTARHERAFT